MEKETKETQKKAAPSSQAAAMRNDTIDLVELAYVLLRRWKMLVLFTVVGALLAGVYHQFLVKPSYQADASIFITNTDSVITISDMQLSSALTEDYSKILTSRSVLKEVIEDQDLDMTFQDLSKLLTISNPESSHIINIAVNCGDADMARNITNSLMNVGIHRIYQIIGTGEPNVIDYSESDSVVETTPGLKKYLMLGGMLGLVLACALITVRFLLDTTLKSEDDIAKYLRLPVLSVVPYYEEGKD